MMSCWSSRCWKKAVNSPTRTRDIILILQIQLQMNLEITLLAFSLWIYLTWFLMIQVPTWPSISILKITMKIQTQVSFSVTFDRFYKNLIGIMKVLEIYTSDYCILGLGGEGIGTSVMRFKRPRHPFISKWMYR